MPTCVLPLLKIGSLADPQRTDRFAHPQLCNHFFFSYVASGASHTITLMERVDEIGMTLRSVGQLGLKCRWMVDEVSKQAHKVRTASESLASGNEALSQRTEQTAANVGKPRRR